MQCVQYWLGKGAKQLSTSMTPPCTTPLFAKTDSVPLDSRSMNEMAEVAEKIIFNLKTVFEKDFALDEFDIVPQESQSNRSPVIHYQHKLGLESWCTGFVYSHSFRNFIFLRPQKSAQLNHSINAANGSSGSSSNNIDYSQFTEAEKWGKCLELTRLILLINPDLTTAWNFRRDAFVKGHTCLQEEFQLVTLVCSRKPKCSEAFGYRKWLVKQALKRQNDPAYSLRFFQQEVKAAHHAASRYFSNYHAWDYRRFIVETWLSSDTVPGEMKMSILHSEKEMSDNWLNTHISDYCGYHYRQKLLLYIIKFQVELDLNKNLMLSELKENRGMLLFYPGHESLWYHRKFLVKQYSDMFDKAELDDSLPLLLSNEQNLVDGILPKRNTGSMDENVANNFEEGGIPISDCVRLNYFYAERYLRWLKGTF